MNDGSNTQVAGFLSEIDRHDDELDSMRGEYMNECKRPREAIKEILTAAKDAGFNPVAFRTLLKEHRDMRAHEKRLALLDLVDKASYESMVASLGDLAATPLGASALKRAKAKDEARPSA